MGIRKIKTSALCGHHTSQVAHVPRHPIDDLVLLSLPRPAVRYAFQSAPASCLHILRGRQTKMGITTPHNRFGPRLQNLAAASACPNPESPNPAKRASYMRHGPKPTVSGLLGRLGQLRHIFLFLFCVQVRERLEKWWVQRANRYAAVDNRWLHFPIGVRRQPIEGRLIQGISGLQMIMDWWRMPF